MDLTVADARELAAVVPLGIELEPYRERLTPLATAVLTGESRRAIDKRRELVLPDVWDDRLREATLVGIAELGTELERKRVMLEAATADLDRPARKSKLVRHVVERVLAELLDANDQNVAALDELERELATLPSEQRAARAAAAARDALLLSGAVPPHELRAAITRTALSIKTHGDQLDRAAAEQSPVLLAETLASDERREEVRLWVRQLAEGGADHVPLLARELRALVEESESSEPANDLIFIQACLGLVLEHGLSFS